MIAEIVLTDGQYDIADLITDLLDKDPKMDYSPSQIARKIKIATWEVHHILRWMVQHNQAGLSGRGGSWTRYRAHRHGELVVESTYSSLIELLTIPNQGEWK